eukprot:scaffold2929_cov145-Skeletonema_menzelii.AAC.8
MASLLITVVFNPLFYDWHQPSFAKTSHRSSSTDRSTSLPFNLSSAIWCYASIIRGFPPETINKDV